LDNDGSQSAEPDPARRRARAAVAAVAVAIGLVGVAVAAPPAVRMPKGSLAGEYWDLVARLDSGQVLIAQTAISSLGIGDRHAAAFGGLVDPDGAEHRFKRSDDPGQWTVTEGGRVDLRSVALDLGASPRRFEVARDELGIDLAFARGAGAIAASDDGTCSFELLEPAAPATAQVRIGAAAPKTTHARVALTHRWSTGLESDCVLWRVELFVLEHDLGIYFAETTTPAGSVSRRLVAERDGKVVFAGDPQNASVRWEPGATGFAPPETIEFAAPGLRGTARVGATLASVDPTERLPAPVQWLVATRTRPRLTWLRAPFEIDADGRRIAGEAVAKVTYSKPLSTVAAHSEE
jgi:hypothetical protein